MRLLVGANQWWILCGLAAMILTTCGCTDPASTGAVISTDSTADVVVRTTVPEQASETVQSDDEGLPRSFYLLDADPAGVLALRLPSDSGELEARVGPWPDGGAGLCVVDAFGALPERVVCFEPGAEGRLFVPLESAGQPAVFMDSRVARVTLQSDVEPERELQLIDVPGVPGARITQGTAEVSADLNATVTFYDQSGSKLVAAPYRPPRP